MLRGNGRKASERGRAEQVAEKIGALTLIRLQVRRRALNAASPSDGRAAPQYLDVAREAAFARPRSEGLPGAEFVRGSYYCLLRNGVMQPRTLIQGTR